jgi:hypothetical protein
MLELFQRAILRDAGVFMEGGGEQVDEDGWGRYHVDITKAPVERDVELWVLHLTIARRIEALGRTKNIHTYATKMAAAWTKLAGEVEGLSYAAWREKVMEQGLKNMQKTKTRSRRRKRR